MTHHTTIIPYGAPGTFDVAVTQVLDKASAHHWEAVGMVPVPTGLMVVHRHPDPLEPFPV